METALDFSFEQLQGSYLRQYSFASTIWLVGSTAGKSKERMMNFCCFLVLSISEALLEVPGSLSN